MNDQQETTANTPQEPQLCKMGCGFFGSNATGDCCSKCWNDGRKKEGGAAAAAPAPAAVPAQQPTAAPSPAPVAAAAAPTATTTSPAPMEVEPTTTAAAPKSPAATTTAPTKKKKKKKMSYKNMMSGMMESSGPRDAEKEKESIQKVTGGGAFVKIDKI